MKITFDDASIDYLKYLNHKLNINTFDINSRKFKKYILSYFSKNNIFDLSCKDYIHWQYYIDSYNFSYNYKSSLHYIFSDFLNFCTIFYDLSDNVAKKVGNFKNNNIVDNGSIWSLNDFSHFIEVVDDLLYKAIFELLFFTGVRKSEALALTWNDIDFNNCFIVINKQTTRFSNNGRTILISPKTSSSNRRISINDNLVNTLNDLYNYYSEHFVKFDNSWFVFGGINPISHTQLKRKKDFYCDIAEVKKIKLHEFRHSHACLLFKNGVPIEDVSRRLGHSSLSMTMDTYLRFLPSNEKRVVDTLNSLKT